MLGLNSTGLKGSQEGGYDITHGKTIIPTFSEANSSYFLFL